MRAVLVVITNVVEEKSLQLPFVHSNDMLQQLPPTAFDPALRHPVLPGTLERGLDRLNPEGSHGSGTSTPYFRSRSKIRNRGTEPNGKASRNCCATHWLVGCLVTLQCRTRLRSWAITKKQYGTPKLMVGTVKKSIAATTSWWLRRKASHRLPGSGSLGARFIQREIVRSEMSNPSISSSPWMRGAPQVGFSATMRKINPAAPSASAFAQPATGSGRSASNTCESRPGASG